MYLGDKIALEDLLNWSVCILTDNGIRNIESEQDLILGNTVFINNIQCEIERHSCDFTYIIGKGQMVRYRPISVILKS